MILRLTVWAGIFALFLLSGLAAHASEEEIAAMLEEIGELAAEEEGNNEAIKIELEQEQAAKVEEAGNPEERRRLEGQRAQNESDAADLIATYGGSMAGREVQCSKKGKTISACESRRVAINQRIDETNAGLQALTAKSDKRSQISQQIAAKRNRNREIRARIAILKSKIAVLRAAGGAEATKQKSNECRAIAEAGGPGSRQRAHRCMSAYWDNARGRKSAPVVEAVQKPSFKVTRTRRTAEQAIAEYKGSGAARQLPKGFRTRALPPPSPKLGR